jgi:hypothetical protein
MPTLIPDDGGRLELTRHDDGTLTLTAADELSAEVTLTLTGAEAGAVTAWLTTSPLDALEPVDTSELRARAAGHRGGPSGAPQTLDDLPDWLEGQARIGRTVELTTGTPTTEHAGNVLAALGAELVPELPRGQVRAAIFRHGQRSGELVLDLNPRGR